MAMPARNLTGQRFGYLTVLERVGSSKSNTATWLCRCECGNEVVRVSQYLRAKHRTHPRSCGCHHGNETHKQAQTPLYNVWVNMRRRCVDSSDKDWPNYGGRGITVCDRWMRSFQNFHDDISAGYKKGLTLGRVDNDGPYSPENCRWETPKQQANNRRSSKFVETPKGRMTVTEAARAYGLKKVTLEARLGRYGWPLEKALLTPTTSLTADPGLGLL